MSVASLTRTRVLATATFVCAAVLLGWPSAVGLPSVYEIIAGPTYPIVRSGLIIADVESREDLALSRLNLPDAEPLPLARDGRDQLNWLGGFASSDQSFGKLVADAIEREGHAREQRMDDLVAYLQGDDFDGGDFVGNGMRGMSSAGGNGVMRRASAVLSGAGASGFSGSPGQGGTNEKPCTDCEPVYGGPRLSEFNEIPMPLGQPAADGVVFTPKVEDDKLVVFPELQIPSTDTPIKVGPPTIHFDPNPDPESPAPVPEPATLVLTGLGVSGLVAKARARRQRSE